MWTSLVGGALAPPERAGPWHRQTGDVWPVVVLLASDGHAAGIRHPGRNVGGNTVAGRCVRSLCAGRSEGAVGAPWLGGDVFPYRGQCPREVRSPKGKARGGCVSILLGRYQTPTRHFTASLSACLEGDKERNSVRTALQKETPGSTTSPVALSRCSRMAPNICAAPRRERPNINDGSNAIKHQNCRRNR
jgi:hypothetical protein